MSPCHHWNSFLFWLQNGLCFFKPFQVVATKHSLTSNKNQGFKRPQISPFPIESEWNEKFRTKARKTSFMFGRCLVIELEKQQAYCPIRVERKKKLLNFSAKHNALFLLKGGRFLEYAVISFKAHFLNQWTICTLCNALRFHGGRKPISLLLF